MGLSLGQKTPERTEHNHGRLDLIYTPKLHSAVTSAITNLLYWFQTQALIVNYSSPEVSIAQASVQSYKQWEKDLYMLREYEFSRSCVLGGLGD